ncbi:MAG: ParM/StbA family protein [Nitrospiraceae bacterium]|nr:ParM/StbA family protein [Nitrospiraceae bacterium]
MIAGIDIGFGEVKVVTDTKKEFKFRSEYSIYNPKTVLKGVNGKVNLLPFDGKDYLIGQEVEKVGGSAITISDVDNLIELAPLFLQSVVKKIGFDKEDPDSVLAVGLPLGAMHRKDDMKRQIRKFYPHNQVIVLAQGVGIFVDSGLKNVLVIDIGHNTVDLFVAENGKIVTEENDMLGDEGVKVITNKLHKYIQGRYEMNLSTPKLQDILRSKKVLCMGKEHDIKEDINEMIDNYSTSLIQRIATQYAQRLRKTEKIVVAGGGSHYVNFRGTKWAQMVHIPEKAEFSNARGFVKIASALKKPAAQAKGE